MAATGGSMGRGDILPLLETLELGTDAVRLCGRCWWSSASRSADEPDLIVRIDSLEGGPRSSSI